MKCRICRHRWHEFHLDVAREKATPGEFRRRRCDDCTACLDDDRHGPSSSSGRAPHGDLVGAPA